jgi:hypothetical protein
MILKYLIMSLSWLKKKVKWAKILKNELIMVKKEGEMGQDIEKWLLGFNYKGL